MFMQAQHSFWPAWARFLQRWGIDGLAAYLLESFGPINLLLAQTIYAGRSLFAPPTAYGQWQALGEMLENKETSLLFASFLREETPQ